MQFFAIFVIVSLEEAGHKVIDPGYCKRCSPQWLSWPSLDSIIWQLAAFTEQATFLFEFRADQELGVEMTSLLRSSSGASRALSMQEVSYCCHFSFLLHMLASLSKMYGHSVSILCMYRLCAA